MFEYRVENNRLITPNTLLLTLVKADNKQFIFSAGQYAAISFYRNGRPTVYRNFSIVSSPNNKDSLQFSIGVKGRFTSAMTRMKSGDRVNVIGPFGDFVVSETDNRHHVMIAGGMGIAPFISMLQSMSGRNSQSNVNLLFSCKTQDNIPFVDDITRLSSQNSRIKPTYFVSRGQVDKIGHLNANTGRINNSTIQKVSENSITKQYLVCGPHKFSDSMKNLLVNNGVPDENIHTESFTYAQNGNNSWFSLPRILYPLGLVGIVLGGLYIATSEALSKLPTPAVNTSNVNEDDTTNSRQQDLDNNLNSNTTSTTTVTNTSSSSGSSTATPICTTTQSGQTVCH